ncbi:hypothetical protein CEXT_300851 [Caerostris extrusa]|uniref:Uncharacterized protein n=1 Tax=Caerostris extrusa TaxID=172846 RepID=A0AAV4MQS9_CAEEX|nr:hypothetical protein CEXT_300851 [Caerostris extrusa]
MWFRLNLYPDSASTVSALIARDGGHLFSSDRYCKTARIYKWLAFYQECNHPQNTSGGSREATKWPIKIRGCFPTLKLLRV